jgi:uridine kinase
MRCDRSEATYRADVTAIAERLALLIYGLPGDRVLVAFDGPDAAGKTTLAGAVAERLRRPTLCASVDGWHNPRDIRLRRGAESPDGYYRDSFDLDALQEDLLTPFRSGAPVVQAVRYDYQHEQAAQKRQAVAPDAALLFDGVFLLRPELVATWDLTIYLHVPEEVTLARAVARDRYLFGDEVAVRQRYERRYLPGQALYRDHASPHEVADISLDNSDWSDPVVLRWPGDRQRRLQRG